MRELVPYSAPRIHGAEEHTSGGEGVKRRAGPIAKCLPCSGWKGGYETINRLIHRANWMRASEAEGSGGVQGGDVPPDSHPSQFRALSSGLPHFLTPPPPLFPEGEEELMQADHYGAFSELLLLPGTRAPDRYGRSCAPWLALFSAAAGRLRNHEVKSATVMIMGARSRCVCVGGWGGGLFPFPFFNLDPTWKNERGGHVALTSIYPIDVPHFHLISCRGFGEDVKNRHHN